MKDYDISKAFFRIENELIDSMMRNLTRHRAEEDERGFDWEQWQVVQLQELERYRQENPEKFGAEFAEIEKRIEEILRTEYKDAYTKQERSTLTAIMKRLRPKKKENLLSLNIGKLEHLIEATKADFARGEWSMLRRANDMYRKIIFDAQIYASAGGNIDQAIKMALDDFATDQVMKDAKKYMRRGMTYEKAVDKATKDLLENGIRPIVYKNGSRHSMEEYASMAIRTGQKRAYLMGEGDVNDQYGLHTVRVNQRLNACPLCIGWIGKVLVDDVYSGGTQEEADKLKVPTLSQAMEMGFLHPNCKDIYSVYVEGISPPAEPWTKKELKQVADNYNVEQAYKRADGMARSYKRMAKWSLDADNRHKYEQRAKYWKTRADELEKQLPADEAEANLDLVQTAGVMDEYYNIRQLLDNMDEHEREIWEDVIDSTPVMYDVSVGAEKQTPNEAVHLNPKSDARTFFHEFGHATDYKYERGIEIELEDGSQEFVSPSGVMDTTSDPDAIYQEIIDYFGYETNSVGKIIGGSNSRSAEASEAYKRNKQRFLDWALKMYEDGHEPWEISVITDCMEALTEGDLAEYSKVGGHKRQYWQQQSFWKTPDSVIFQQGIGTKGTREWWAHICSLKALRKDDTIELLREISPTMVEEMEYAYDQIFNE